MIYYRFCCVTVLLLTLGCGPTASPNSATVSGVVTLNGASLNSGRIYFNIDNGSAVRSAEIQVDGSYQVVDVPAGMAGVAIMVPPAPSMPSNDPTAPAVTVSSVTPVSIPKKYEKVETSKLTYEIVPGEQTRDIHLQ
ncbi:hypothetical protein M4951_13205 [Blastopirellula sp. J2-11]|uniref:hypothetical protein n=1 Tax=Blastopirellula sp. J2-11 TaxID=2943192 RepID=UPI0021C74357|nr:hypothetical protein [Blastopirellula sp. J2-11]UUO04351.1 hypothetical protein M4951_13205 [Blastopirellula sp. J2-11]